MGMTNEKRAQVKELLLKNMSVLEELVENETKKQAIRLNMETLELGYVHIALAGQTSCGKSTVVNALSERHVCPENPMTATLIPSYIVQSVEDQDLESVTIIPNDETEEISEMSREEFFIEYCLNAEGQGGGGWQRWKHEKEKYTIAHAKGTLFEKGGVLLDTLGSCASEKDDIKTNTILKGGVDYVIYIVGGSILVQTDIAFLQYHILGYHPNDPAIKAMNHEVQTPVVPLDRLIILANDKTGVLRSGLEKSVQRIFNSDDCASMSQEEKEDFCKKNVWVANALYGRLNNAGFFDYVRYAPVGSDAEYKKEAEDMNDMQQLQLEAVKSQDPMIVPKVEQWKEFQAHIVSLCDSCFEDESQFVLNKYGKVLRDFKGAKKDFEKSIEKLEKDWKKIKDRKRELEKISETIRKRRSSLSTDIVAMYEGMMECVDRCLNGTDHDYVIADIYGGVIADKKPKLLESVPQQLPLYKTVKDATAPQQQTLLEPVVEPVVNDMMSESGLRTSKYLWTLAGSEAEEINDDVPIKHYKTVIRYLNDHINNILGIVAQMKDADVSVAGIVLPDREDLTKIADEVELNILKAIEESFNTMADSANWANAFGVAIQRVVKQNFFAKIISFFNGGVTQEKFWGKICDDLFPTILMDMGNQTTKKIRTLIKDPVLKAYMYVQSRIDALYEQCTYDCREAMNQMDKMDAEGTQAIISSLKEKVATCQNAIREIESELAS